ncbi:histidine kinase [Streptomyces sp. NPDC005562]|uniref:sensor histidine kinase n=1 Tax=Streptomyces sp. NPDC005562 TaxID=3154890 RepID=UPI0033A0CE5F
MNRPQPQTPTTRRPKTPTPPDDAYAPQKIDWPLWVQAGCLLGLAALTAWDALFLEHLSPTPKTVVVTCGALCSLCAVPGTPAPLTARAATAATATWCVTFYFLLGTEETGVWGVGETIALWLLLAAILWRAAHRTALILGPLLAVACVGIPLRDANPGEWTLVSSLITAIIAAFSLLLRAQTTQRARDLDAVRAAERRALARELHDVVAHHITGIAIQAKASRYAQTDAQTAHETLRRIEYEATNALESMKRLVSLMRRAEAVRQSLQNAAPTSLASLQQMARDFETNGPHTEVDLENGLEENLPTDIRAAIHRITREALTNIRKHATDATHVHITLNTTTEGIELRITNDGHQPAPLPHRARGGGFGIAGMRERAVAMEGRLEAGPAHDGGWQVTAVIPRHPATP